MFRKCECFVVVTGGYPNFPDITLQNLQPGVARPAVRPSRVDITGIIIVPWTWEGLYSI